LRVARAVEGDADQRDHEEEPHVQQDKRVHVGVVPDFRDGFGLYL
jgi:hypothetical protein